MSGLPSSQPSTAFHYLFQVRPFPGNRVSGWNTRLTVMCEESLNVSETGSYQECDRGHIDCSLRRSGCGTTSGGAESATVCFSLCRLDSSPIIARRFGGFLLDASPPANGTSKQS